MIEFENVGIRFGKKTLLKGVTFRIEKGEAVVIIGPSGQGKTLLLKLMAGLVTPTEGEVRVEGNSLLTLRGDQRAALLRKMGMLFQKNALFDSLTCGDNIAFPLRETTALSEGEIQSKVESFLEAVGISHAKNLYPDEISGGMQKRLGIARALAADPEIIFYDDPTAGLDPITSRNIIRLIIDLKQKSGSTVVAITNDMNRAYQMADRVMMVVGGGVIITGSAEETKNHSDPRVHQFVRGALEGPLTETQEDEGEHDQV